MDFEMRFASSFTTIKASELQNSLLKVQSHRHFYTVINTTLVFLIFLIIHEVHFVHIGEYHST